MPYCTTDGAAAARARGVEWPRDVGEIRRWLMLVRLIERSAPPAGARAVDTVEVTCAGQPLRR